MGSKKYFVYKHTSPSGKIYIGVTCVKKPEYRWNHGRGYSQQIYFWNAIQKYGWDNFKHEILYSNLTREEASELEIKLIKQFKADNPEFGYNQIEGGLVDFSSEHMSEKQKERFDKLRQDEEAWKAFCKSQARPGEKNGMFGKHHTEATKKKIIENQVFTEESRQKVSKATRVRQLGEKNIKARAVVQTTKDLIFVAEFKTIREAALSLNFITKKLCSVESYINHVCMHDKDHQSAYGYLWFYAEEYYSKIKGDK